MPHLSPMAWAICPILFWIITLMIMSSFWWHQPALFPDFKTSTNKSLENQWNWLYFKSFTEAPYF